MNHDIGKGRVVEGGGQWVGPTQTAILSLCKELGVETFKTYLKGSLVYKAGGIRIEVPYAAAGEATTKLQKKIDALAAQVPLNAPWQAKKAAEWDAMTLEDWMRDEAVNAADRSTLSGAAALTLGTTPQRLSFLYFLYYVHSAGSLHDLESMGGGAQDSRIKGGSQILSLKMAKELADHVRLGEPVQRIRQNDKSVVVETTKGSVEAGQVVMALMPGSCTRIRFEPELPEARRQLQARWVQKEGGVKINVVYDRPFWRDRGLSGMSLSDAGPVPFTIDNTPPEGTPGVIMLFAESHELAKGSSAQATDRKWSGRIIRQSGRHPSRVLRNGLECGKIHGGLRLAARAGSADEIRCRTTAEDRANPLGGHRNVRKMDGLHGRRDSIRFARGKRSR